MRRQGALFCPQKNGNALGRREKERNRVPLTDSRNYFPRLPKASKARAGQPSPFVKRRTVTLRGEADSDAQRDLTTEYAMDVDGVETVNNEMTVSDPAAEKPDDKTMAKKRIP